MLVLFAFTLLSLYTVMIYSPIIQYNSVEDVFLFEFFFHIFRATIAHGLLISNLQIKDKLIGENNIKCLIKVLDHHWNSFNASFNAWCL